MQIKETTQFIIHGSYVVRILVSGEAIFRKRPVSSPGYRPAFFHDSGAVYLYGTHRIRFRNFPVHKSALCHGLASSRSFRRQLLITQYYNLTARHRCR